MRKWILNFIEIIIFLVIFLVCVVGIVQSTLFKENSIFGYRTYTVASNSMYPVFEYGDIIVVKKLDYNNIKVDDIITYNGQVGEFKNKVITHEVIDIVYENDTKVLRTKGRANTGIDPNVYEKQVLGKFVYKFMLISFVNKIISDRFGFFLFVFIPVSILIVLELIHIIKEIKRRKLEKLVKYQIEELKKIDMDSKESMEIENTMCVQLEYINSAKRDFKKINELEDIVRVPLEDIIKKIEFFKNAEKQSKLDQLLKDDTVILFDSNDIRKEIRKELNLRDKKVKKRDKN